MPRCPFAFGVSFVVFVEDEFVSAEAAAPVPAALVVALMISSCRAQPQ